MKNLTDIGEKCGTDKSLHHRYLSLYQLLFREACKLPEQRILEIGIQNGLSLKTWDEYFPNPKITGIDVFDNGFRKEGIEVIIADAYCTNGLLTVDGKEFDLIIDDGSHEPENQRFVLENYYRLLSDNGILIIEDVRTKDAALMLKRFVPEGFLYTIVDMTEGNSIVDSRLFIMWHK